MCLRLNKSAPLSNPIRTLHGGPGGFDLLTVLEAQRTVYATRLEIARAEFQKAKVQIEALTGR